MSEKKPTKKRTAPKPRSTAHKPVVTRRRKRKPAGRRALVDAPPDRCFWVNYGPVLKDLRELRDALAHGISDAQFAYHVGPGKNDFANWVEAVLDDAACAKALRRARTRSGARRAVAAGLRIYA